MRNVDIFGIFNTDSFGIVGKAGKVSNVGAVVRLWRYEKC